MALPKPPSLRQRRNRKASEAILRPPLDVQIPELPNPDRREFHHLTVQWWVAVWSSPMASRYETTDGLSFLVLLVDDFYKATGWRERLGLAAEIRLQTSRYGLSPQSRAQLDWRILPEPEQRQAETVHTGTDPRKVLKFGRSKHVQRSKDPHPA